MTLSKRLIVVLSLFSTIGGCMSKSESIYLAPFQDKTAVTEGETTENFTPQADILFVVDNSGSMSPHQINLSANISQFITEFLRQPILAYNIAVVSTDVDGFGQPTRGAFAGTTKVVNKQTPNGARILAENLKLGIRGSGLEAPFDATHLALDPALLAAGNAGFLRKNAALVVIFITDAEDQSDIRPQALYEYLVNTKDGRKNKVFSFGAIIPTAETRCARDAFEPPRLIEEFLGIVQNSGNNVMNLCASDFGQKLAEAASQIVDQVGNKIYLSRAPEISTLKVTYGSVELQPDARTGWTFDPLENAVVLGKEIDWNSQPPDSEIRVDYTAAKFEN